MSVNEMFFDRYPDTTLEHQIQVRPYNAALTKNMRSLNPEGRVVAYLLGCFRQMPFFVKHPLAEC